MYGIGVGPHVDEIEDKWCGSKFLPVPIPEG
jgi:hypothetical protein